MPRSSRHKSSKHSSREAREYSDSEKESSLKDRKGKEESSAGTRVSKESEKRKVDSSKEAKDQHGAGNGNHTEEHGSSKRRRDRAGDGVSDRWNGGEEDRAEVSKKSKELKASGELKSSSSSRRREEGGGVHVDGEEGKKSSGKHRESGRKDGKEGGIDREKKSKEGKSEKLVIDGDEQREMKKVVENTDFIAQSELRSPDPENQLERRMRKRRDGSGDWEKHQDGIGDVNDRRLLSREDIGKDVRQKDEKRKDDRSKDKHREDIDRDNKHHDDKQNDERIAKDHMSIRSDDKRARDEKDSSEIRQKRTKIQDGDRSRDRERDRDRDVEASRDRDRCHDRDRERDGDRGRDHSRDRDRDRERDWDWDHDRDRDRDRDRDHDRGRDRFRDRDRGRDNDHEYERDHDHDRDLERDGDRHHDDDGSHLNGRSSRYKDGKGKKRSPVERDDSDDNKTRVVKSHYPESEKKSFSGGKVDSDADRGRSQSRQAHLDAPTSSSRRRTSPSSSSHAGIDDYRHLNLDDLKYRDKSEQRSKAISSKDVNPLSGVSEKGAKYRSVEKPAKMDDGHLGELSAERSSSSKASPRGMVERSPSSTSIERRYTNRTGVRRSLDIEETGRRSSASIDARDFSTTEDRLYREFVQEKPLLDDSQADSAYYSRNSQSGASSLIPPPAFRGGVDSPTLVGSLEEDGRLNSTPRYKRGGDGGLGRGHGNAWRGVPNWSSSVPNGFIPFQHGPPHGGFQAMIPQFTSQSLFGVRPAVEINHSGIHYHIPEADRFSGHLRPVGWQNMMDGSGPPHLHGWDGSNGSGPSHMYGGPEWDQKRHSMSGRGWESAADLWKGQDTDMKRELPSPSRKDDYVDLPPADDSLAMKAGQRSHHEDNYHEVQAKNTEIGSTGTSPVKEASDSLPKPAHEAANHAKSSIDDVAYLSRFYLSKLDISTELAHPELYHQCISLLDIEQSTTKDEGISMDVLLEDAGRASLKPFNWSLSHSLFPATKDSVFQRALDLYKKQRVDVVGLQSAARRTIDIISPLNRVTVEEPAPICNTEEVEEPTPTVNAEMPSEPMSTTDQKNVEALSVAVIQENMEDPVSTVSQETESQVFAQSQEVVLGYVGEDPGELVPVSSREKDQMVSEEVNVEVADGECLSTGGNESQTVAKVSMDGEMYEPGKSNCDNSTYYTEERLSGDAINGPKFFPGGSPRTCEAFMPGSNESESVILSRIHHSPESTH